MKKVINQENMLEPDPVMSVYVKISFTSGAREPVTRQDGLNLFLGPTLQGSVPLEVQALFEGARGAMIYGYLYYRLYYLGLTELTRVAEAAAHHKCKAEGKLKEPGKKYDNFNDYINWLETNGHIQQADVQWWTDIRDARNFASHPSDSGLITPAMAIMALERIAARINTLFSIQS